MYLLNCSVCKGKFKTKESWACHLIKKRHLNKARRKCVRWSPKRRSQVLVAYATFSMSSPLGLSLLQILSKDLLTFVTDFVWREGNSRVGLIQFESSDRLTKLLATLGNPQTPRIEVDGYPVTFRRAIDLVDLEWESLVTPELKAEMVSVKGRKRQNDEAEAKDEKAKRKRTLPERKETETESFVSTNSVVPLAEIQLSGSECGESLNNCHHHDTSSTDKNQSLKEKFSSLLEPLKIPDSEFNVILGIIRDIEVALAEKNTTVRVVMLRNWYLQLRTSTRHNPPPLLLFVYREDNLSSNPIKWTPVMKSRWFRRLWTSKLSRFNCGKNSKDLMPGVAFVHKDSGIRCVIGHKPNVLVDVQRCRLLQYYLTFDPRIKSLFTLIYLWTDINGVHISKKIRLSAAHRDISGKAALEWLLVVFLCQEKIIPTPREIQRKQHKGFHVQIQKKSFDVGFSENPKLAERWSAKFNIAEDTDEFALSVLKLAGNFFYFCASLAAEPCLINTKDAEVLPSNFFLKAKKRKNIPQISTKLSPGELEILRSHLNNKKIRQTLQNITIRHPFILTCSFSIDGEHFKSDISPKMETTGEKLLGFVERIEVIHDENNESLSSMYTNVVLESLLKC